MNLKKLKTIFTDNGCSKIYVKVLSPNDNSKNQVYFAGDFDILNIFPISEIITEPAGDWEKERFKAKLNFSWIAEDSNIYPAPNSQFILYPKYPEVRFSGFLLQCKKAPSELMTQRLQGRLLFMSVAKNGNVLGFVTSPTTEIANEFSDLKNLDEYGVFKIIELGKGSSRTKLLHELLRIHQLGWINSKRLDAKNNILPCLAPQCGGYTLEAELGIIPNGYSEPDFLGWEVKQFNVKNFNRINSSVITLMTPEPTHGYYVQEGSKAFILKYGYADLLGREDRMNFGGIHKVGIQHSRTNLRLVLVGFNVEEGKIRNTSGKIVLLDRNDNEAASWSFASMLMHWNRKHSQACYVPSLSEKEPIRRYQYSNNIILGSGTDFQLFLSQMALGNIYYDPGIKLENMSTKPKVKNRSQFRTTAVHLKELYKVNEIIDINNL